MPNENNLDEQQSNEPTGNDQQGGQGGSTYTPPASQAELNRIIENRLQRERAKYADYDQLKADSVKLGEVVAERDGLKTQLDAANSELSGFKKEKEVRDWAAEVSQETGVPADILRGETKEEMLAHAKTLEKYVKVSAPVVRGDGKSPKEKAGTSTRDIFADALEGII